MTRSFAVSVAGAGWLGRRRGNLAGNLPAQTALDASMAVLVADGAAPTQAHVTTAAGDWTAYKAALSAAVTAQSSDMVLTYDETVLTTKNAINQAIRELQALVDATGV